MDNYFSDPLIPKVQWIYRSSDDNMQNDDCPVQRQVYASVPSAATTSAARIILVNQHSWLGPYDCPEHLYCETKTCGHCNKQLHHDRPLYAKELEHLQLLLRAGL